MRYLKAAAKGGWLAAHIALGAAAAFVRPQGFEERFVPWWCREACRILSLRVRLIGAPPPAPALWVANHVSWLEVIALKSIAPLTCVAKDDVRRWPVIGLLAAAAGTLFLRRGSARAASRTMLEARGILAGGRSVAVFPEGTSTSGGEILAFHASFFEAAARLGGVVQPVAVFYPPVPGRPVVAPFIGDDEFLPHLLRVLAEAEVVIELAFAPVLDARGRTRQELAYSAREAVVAGLRARQDDPRRDAPGSVEPVPLSAPDPA